MTLRQALFFDLGSSVLKLPVSLINVLSVDEVGQVWFFLNRPAQHINEFDHEFRSRLDLYRKGEPFYLHVWGKACLVSDPEEMHSIAWLTEEQRRAANSHAILVRLKIHEIKYFPLRVPAQPVQEPESRAGSSQPLALVKGLQYIVKDILPVFQSH